jgi:hypothetical protein
MKDKKIVCLTIADYCRLMYNYCRLLPTFLKFSSHISNIFAKILFDMDRELKMRYSYKDLAGLMDVSIRTMRKEITGNEPLMQQLKGMGWQSYQRFRKQHVLEIFKSMGFPSGYEWYNQQQEQEQE